MAVPHAGGLGSIPVADATVDDLTATTVTATTVTATTLVGTLVATSVSIVDSAADFTATNVETALAELQTDAEADDAALVAHLADTVDAHDASAISILDTAADFTAIDVEGALAELQTADEADEAALAAHAVDTTSVHGITDTSVIPLGTVGYAQVTANQLGVSGVADLTSLTLTFTFVTGRRYRITGYARLTQKTSAGDISLRIRDGAAATINMCVFTAAINGTVQGMVSAIVVPGAGSKTYKLSLDTTAGTVDMSAAATIPAFILIEDVGV